MLSLHPFIPPPRNNANPPPPRLSHDASPLPPLLSPESFLRSLGQRTRRVPASSSHVLLGPTPPSKVPPSAFSASWTFSAAAFPKRGPCTHLALRAAPPTCPRAVQFRSKDATKHPSRRAPLLSHIWPLTTMYWARCRSVAALHATVCGVHAIIITISACDLAQEGEGLRREGLGNRLNRKYGVCAVRRRPSSATVARHYLSSCVVADNACLACIIPLVPLSSSTVRFQLSVPHQSDSRLHSTQQHDAFRPRCQLPVTVVRRYLTAARRLQSRIRNFASPGPGPHGSLLVLQP